VSGGVIAFRGLYPGGQGIYTWSGGTPALVANSATSIPGGGSFAVFWSPTSSGSTAVFAGGMAPGAPPFIPFRGVYTGNAFGVGTVADLGTPSPSGGGNFIGFAPPTVSGTTAAFFAGSPTGAGIYTRSTSGTGSVAKIADTATAAPGLGGSFGNFLPPAISGSTVAFIGGSNPNSIGVYAAPAAGGALTTIATTSTIIPGSTLPFRQLGGDPNAGPVNAPGPSISGSVVAFAGSPNLSGPSLGIYATTGPGGQLARIADTTTPVPGGTGLFTQFDPYVSLSGDDLVFVGHSTTGPGIYTNATGPLTRLIAVGETLDGRTVADLEIGRQSFDGSVITFWAGFTDGSSGIYVAPVPEPAGLLAVGIAAVGLFRLARRRPV
jgi:hypothetical protein